MKKRASLVYKSQTTTVPQQKLASCDLKEEESVVSEAEEWARRKQQVQEALAKGLQAMLLAGRKGQ